jgi:uncharacterized membrane protein YdjX (TVP38/TMEM64 family)
MIPIKKKNKQIITSLLILMILVIIWYAGIAPCLNLTTIQQKGDYLIAMVNAHYAAAVALYILLFTLCIFLGFPVVLPFSVLSGYLFEHWWGILYALIGVTAGSMAYFVSARHAFSKTIQNSYATQLTRFKERVATYGSYYLLFIHFITVIPYVIINTLAALADVPIVTFFWTTVIGAIPSIWLYNSAGKQLKTIRSTCDIIQPKFFLILLVLAIVSLMPIVIHKYRTKQKP